MVKSLAGFLFLALVVLLETAVLPFFPVFGTEPSLLLTILLSWQFLGLTEESYSGAFLGGALLDLFTGRPWGFSGLTLLLLSGAAGLVRRFASNSLPILLLTTFLASVVFRLSQILPTFHLQALLTGGLLDGGVLLLVYPLWRYFLKNVFARREIEVGV